MSRRRKSTVYIKCVEPLTEEEFGRIDVLKSIGNLFDNAHDRVGYYAPYSLKFMYVNPKDRQLVSRVFNTIAFGSKLLQDSFHCDKAIQPVRIVYSDGHTDYGFKYYTEKRIVNRKKSVLRPLYTKDGYINSFGEVEDAYDIDDSTRVNAWVLRMLPQYNEKMMDDESGPVSQKSNISGIRAIRNAVDSNYVCKEMISYSTPPVCPDFGKVAWKFETTPNPEYTLVRNRWSDRNIISEYQVFGDKTYRSPRVACYSYLKSIYYDNISYRKAYGIIPISDLLSIRVPMSSGGKGNDDEEVWNNLDSTVHGIL